MDNNRYTKILFWNIRGINAQPMWDAVRDKISESACQILCIQETKRETFDSFYIKKFCPRPLDPFAFFPSIGACGGLLTMWNSTLFDGTVVHSNAYSITIKFLCRLDHKTFHVSNIYGPAASVQKPDFITWLMNFDTSTFDDWILGETLTLSGTQITGTNQEVMFLK